MARSTLFSLLYFLVVLLLVVTTSKAQALFRLVNGDNWAKNFPPGAGRPPFYTGVIVDENFASIYERWEINRFEEGFTIRNSGTGFWLTAHDGEVQGTSEFDAATSKWYIQSAGEGKFKIVVPNKDLVVSALRKKSGYPVSLFLEPADGTPSQLWSFERLAGNYANSRCSASRRLKF